MDAPPVPERLPDDAHGRQVWAVPAGWTIYWRASGEPQPPHEADILIAQAGMRAAQERAARAVDLAHDAMAGSKAAQEHLARMQGEGGK
jgi:hypothetical protein